MSFDVNIAGTTIPTNTAALKSFRDDLNLAFSLGPSLVPLLNTAIGSIPSSASKTSISYNSPSASWSLGGGPVQFGLQGGVTGTLEVINKGDLVSFTDGLDSPQQKSITIAPNVTYLKLTLGFKISANVAGNYSGGAYGVKAALDTSDTYAISFCKAFVPSTLLCHAIGQTFESFVLPLHADTLTQMGEGDYLLHEFDGNLHLGFGAYAGLDKVLYAGQSSVDVIKAFGSPLATFSGAIKPEISVGATLDFSFQYATRFEALLSKENGRARLHLFRSANATDTTTLKAGLTVDANTSASIASQAQTYTDSLVKAAGGASSEGGAALGQVLSSAQAVSEINKYISEVDDNLANWLKRANGLQANLQVAIETSRSRTILGTYDFDAASLHYRDAWHEAINGDFVAALQTGAVALGVGSGLEQAYQSKTSFSCNLFNLWSMSTWSQFASNVSMVYAGNNVFHLVAKIDRTTETDSIGAMHSMDVYFSANADAAIAGQLSNADINFHIDLTAKNDPKAASKIATMLSATEGGPICDALAKSMHAFATNSKNGITQLQVTIPLSAFARINCDPYIGDKPQTTSNYNDSVNWAEFARAADDLDAWPLRNMSTVSWQNLTFLKSFRAWEELNEAANGSTTPNRINRGNAFNHWPDDFPQVDDGDRNLIVYSMLADQSFMNFCADLRELAEAGDVNFAGRSWNELVKLITDATQNELSVDFLRPAALATIRQCKSQIPSVSGPTGESVPDNHFAISMTL